MVEQEAIGFGCKELQSASRIHIPDLITPSIISTVDCHLEALHGVQKAPGGQTFECRDLFRYHSSKLQLSVVRRPLHKRSVTVENAGMDDSIGPPFILEHVVGIFIVVPAWIRTECDVEVGKRHRSDKTS